jgi:hypothetical protein
MSPEARERSFDELAMELASGSISRGKALRLMGAAVVGGALGSLGIREAAAAPGGCKRNGKSCKNDDQCCSENCDDSGICADAPPTCGATGATCTGNTDCCSGLVCKGPSGQRTCAESCIPPNAIPCDPGDILNEDCGGIGSPCRCVSEASGGGYCSSEGTGIACTTACDCPAGQVCTPFATGGLCTVVAEVCPTG